MHAPAPDADDALQLCADKLRLLSPFAELAPERLEWVCQRTTARRFEAGEVIVRDGDTNDVFFILAEGAISVTKHTEGHDIPVGRHDAPSYFGEIQIFTDEPFHVTSTAVTSGLLYTLGRDDFRALMVNNRAAEREIFKTILRRTRGFESFIRHREKMASLGTLSAGLAHELNNPTAALSRALDKLGGMMLALEQANLHYGAQRPDAAHTDQWQAIKDRGCQFMAEKRLKALEKSDREDQWIDWLEDRETPDPWEIAATLAQSGLLPEDIEHLADQWPLEVQHTGFRWLAHSLDVYAMLNDGRKAAAKITDLVAAIKSYSYMDQGAQQHVDLHQGIEDTLKILHHKLKYGVEVVRDYDETIEKVCVYGSEMNQVWTNLIDNAIDAMGGKGTLEIRTRQENRHAVVKIKDNGSGIPEEAQRRIFEPFFSTKGVGKGSGLGLDIAHRIVVVRHSGHIDVESRPGCTVFTVSIPLGPR
ncbi:MAG: sensor histidine kinase [Candidatus Competibacterales bacterium]